MKTRLLVLLVALSARGLWAQADRGVITGLVTDPQGAPIANTVVTIKDSRTGVTTDVNTSATGNYSTPPLIIGTYEVSVKAAGFKTFHAANITLASGQTFRQDASLQVGDVQQAVEVSAQTEQLNSDNAQVSASVNQIEYESLPAVLAGENRVPETQLYTFPTFTAPTQGNIYPGSAFGARINGGQRSAFENFLDGASYGEVSGHNGTQERSAPYESIAESRIIDNTFNAQYGHTSGGFVEYTTKSGTDKYHGGIYEYFDNDKLQARGEIVPERPPVRQNQYGFTLGGPISIPKIYNGKNRSFFFFNFDQFKYTNAGASSGLGTVADNNARAGNFAPFLTSAQIGTDACGRSVLGGQIFDPATTRSAAVACGGSANAFVRDAFPNNQIPVTSFSRVATNIQNVLPAPSNGALFNNYLLGPTQAFLNARTILTRIDHNITPSIRFALTYNYTDRPRLLDGNNIGGNGEPIGHPRYQDIVTHTAHAQGTWVISPTFFTHVVASYDRWVLPDTYPTIIDRGLASSVGITGIPFQDQGGFPSINFDGRYTGFGVSTNNGFQATDRWQALDDTTKIIGAHTIKFGVEYRWERWVTGATIGDAGNYTFHAANTGAFDATGTLIGGSGNPYASFLLGQVSSAGFTIPSFSDYRRPYFSPWVNDDWKVNDKLTLSLGFRYDLQFPRTERHNEFSSFDPTLPNPGAGGRLGALAFAGQNGHSNTFEDLVTDAWGPRFGFAYRIGDKSVVRGGYGIYYSGVTMNQFNANPNYGYSSNPTVTDLSNGRQSIFSLDNGFPQASVAIPPQIRPTLQNGSNLQYMNPNGIKLPRYQNWTLSVQRQLTSSMLLDVAYVANKGDRLITGPTLNDLNQNNPGILQQYPLSELTATVGTPAANGFPSPYPGFTGTVAQALRPYPQYLSIPQFNGANGGSIYHSLQTTFRKNFSSGVQLSVAYVYSKLLNNGADFGLGYGTFGASAATQPISTYLPTKALSVDDVPNVITITGVGQLPFGRGKTFMNRGGVLNAVFGGWSVAGNLRYESGRPLGIYYSNNPYAQVLFNTGYLPDRVQGVSGYVNHDNGNFDIVNSRYLTSSAFTTPGAGSLGNESRVDSVLRGWANYNENVSLFKDFTFKEFLTWRIGGNASNLLNRHQWNDPDTNLSDGANFGQVSGQSNLPRAFQIYMKLNF